MFHVESWFYKKRLCKELINYLNANKKSNTQKGVPYPDGSYTEDTCIIELQDTINCKNQIFSFKQLNQWNEPYIFN